MKRSTSDWMSSRSFFCRVSSSSCPFACFCRSFLLFSSGPRASSTVSFCDCVFLYCRLARSRSFWCCENSPVLCRHSMLSSSSSWSRATRFRTSSAKMFFSRSRRFFTSSQDWSVSLELSVMSCRRICFLVRWSSDSLRFAASFVALSFTDSISAFFSACASCSAFTALSNFSACLRMRSGSERILMCSASCVLWIALLACLSSSMSETLTLYSSSFCW
mmetsp:Transcript_1201/g.3009  ORF Transcript_1201/g.3009 Transcript_1201/m.3009 type:complete len:219 (-) Transcript_1201:612-1268(-)